MCPQSSIQSYSIITQTHIYFVLERYLVITDSVFLIFSNTQIYEMKCSFENIQRNKKHILLNIT